jgi:hypothetical protein
MKSVTKLFLLSGGTEAIRNNVV